MIVYRVEAEDSLGPYRHLPSRNDAQNKLAETLLLTHADTKHPTPNEEGVPVRTIRNGLMGFKSIENLTYWFEEHLESLAQLGYYMATYKVDPKVTWVTPTQVVFLYGDCIDRKPLEEIVQVTAC